MRCNPHAVQAVVVVSEALQQPGNTTAWTLVGRVGIRDREGGWQGALKEPGASHPLLVVMLVSCFLKEP